MQQQARADAQQRSGADALKIPYRQKLLQQFVVGPLAIFRASTVGVVGLV